VVLVPRRVFQRLLQERPTPERCVKHTTCSGPVSSALPSANSAGANWPKTATSRSPDGTCEREPPGRG
jgi:hypothetical protein